MQGKMVDMEKLMRQNELVPAVGNANLNARGDKLGAGGKIVKRREDMVAEYYESNPKVARKKTLAKADPVPAPVEAIPDMSEFEPPEEIPATITKPKQGKA
jgi:hypothetical protein